MAEENVNHAFGPRALFRPQKTLVHPLLLHVVAPFVDGDDRNFSLQINGNLLWRNMGVKRKSFSLYSVFKLTCERLFINLKNLSAFDCVAKKLNYKTGRFLKQIKGEQNGKRRTETWTNNLN